MIKTTRETLKITDFAWSGYGIARDSRGKVVMIPGTVPGDTVNVEIQPSTKKITLGKILELIESSGNRVTHPCPHAHEGCVASLLGNYEYAASLRWKASHLEQTIVRVGGLAQLEIEQPLASPKIWGYRNRLELSLFSINSADLQTSFKLGYSSPDRQVPVRCCRLVLESIQQSQQTLFDRLSLLSPLKDRSRHIDKKNESGARLLLHDNGHDQVVGVVFIEPRTGIEVKSIENWLSCDALKGWRIHLTPTMDVRFWRSRVLAQQGDLEIYHPISNDRELCSDPLVFSQANRAGASYLVSTVMNELNAGGRLLDCYGGYGAFGIAQAQRGGTSVILESSPEAIKAGRNFVKQHRLPVTFIMADLNHWKGRKIKWENFPAAILDPPRRGVNQRFLEVLKKSGLPILIYVSCHPAALARDVKILADRYRPVKIIPLDLFPNTPNLETVVVMYKK